ncbi:hypothetical protein PR048_026211 [Dryococelus australis]|uniref:CHK kinase-like domain-containing protein n=1 Tax=Dryococelus australis TaxID=614101 RepID=A0ABQ9GKQ4_9NEOP|nr:hypothetical protein PR048_026211 [Dryococelus australis]
MTADSSALTKQDLEELLRPKLDAEGAQVEDVTIRRLTKPGDNMGSTMLAVDVSLKPGPRTLHLVAKMLPKSIALQGMFQCDTTVRKETNLYLLVRPAYERIQKENNVPEDKFLDVFPVCHGARENLKVQGYESGDRFNGLDLAHCELVVDKLARFHATAVAMKIKKPDEFRETVLQAAATVVIGPGDAHRFAKILEAIPAYETMKERITTALLRSTVIFNDGNPKPPREPFATITHLDLWVNNIMFQYGPGSSKENPKKMKFVDFQITRYDSPARDLLFFLYSSAKLEVLSEHYDYLVRLYYDSFIDCLQLLGCDATPFRFEDFLEELKNSSVIEFWHIIFMSAAISMPLEGVKSTDDERYEGERSSTKIGKTFASRANKLILDFASRNWI